MTTAIHDRLAAPGSARPPNVEARQITGRPYLSHSQLQAMRSCPRRFGFQYVEKAPRDFIPSALIFGGSFHSALELHLRCRMEGLQVTCSALWNAFQDAYRRQREDAGADIPVRFNKKETEQSVSDLAGRMIDAFLDSPLANPKGTILGIEEELRVVLDPELPDVLARVDLVTQTEGALHVVDFKTSRSRWTEEKALESGEQLVLYGVTVSQMSRHLGVPVKLHFGVVTKHKTPQVQILPVPTDPDRVASMKDSVAQVWQAIKTGNFYPSPSPQNCSTCQFKSRCPVFAGH